MAAAEVTAVAAVLLGCLSATANLCRSIVAADIMVAADETAVDAEDPLASRGTTEAAIVSSG